MRHSGTIKNNSISTSYLFIIMFLIMISFKNQAGQIQKTVLPGKKLNVYFKGDGDIIEVIKSKLTIINYPRDLENADLLILILSHSTADGGNLYDMVFTGAKKFKGVDDTLKISFQKTDSKEKVLDGLEHLFKIGLVRYISHTRYLNDLNLSYSNINLSRHILPVDNWNYWVFNLSSTGSLDAEQSKKSYSFKGAITANRETNASKINLELSVKNKLQSFNLDTAVTKSLKRSLEAKGLYVKSVNNHFSVGVYLDYYSSSFENIKKQYSIMPAFEYDYFPYSESLSRELSLRYKIGFTNYNYYERTIYGKLKQDLLYHEIRIQYDFKEIWGSANLSLSGAQFLNDLSKNHLEFDSNVSMRIFEGFSVTAELNVNLLHDQIYLPANGTTEEEILLNQKQLASQYEVYFDLGFSYTFGSIYNNIINTRF